MYYYRCTNIYGNPTWYIRDEKMEFNSAVGVSTVCSLWSLLGTIPLQDGAKKLVLEEMHGLVV
jgi:hypothetical protein